MVFLRFEIQKYIIISRFSFEMCEDIGDSPEMPRLWPLIWTSSLYIWLLLQFLHF